LNLNIKIINRNNKLYLEYYENGIRYKKSTKLNDTKAHRAFINRELVPNIMKSIIEKKEINIFDTKKQKYEKTIYFYLYRVEEQTKRKKTETQRAYNFSINIFKKHFKNKEIEKINKNDIDLYLTELTKNYKKASIKAIIAPIKLAFNIAYEDGLINKKIKFEINLKDDKEEKESLTKEQINLLLNNANGVIKDYLNIALYTGLRISEILAIQWTDINFEKEHIHIQRIIKYGREQLPKNNKKWFCPLNPKLKDYLLTLENNNKFVINSTDNKINLLFKELQKKLLFEKIYSSHTLRHTFISQGIMAGLSPHYIKLFTGHKSVDMINNTYTHYQINLEEIKKYNKQINF